ncbi:MAG: NnrU family protein [Halieaceae bacterium]|nr:NnrU family protein [Halieaceae bacterium]
MSMLITGVLLWSLLHFVPAGLPAQRAAAVNTLGEGAYKGIFAVLMLAALAAIIFGWRSATPSVIYTPPPALRPVAVVLTLIGFVLMAAANHPTRIGRVVRHPQLTGVLLWAIAHLLANGDSRSLVLFGGFSVWCVVMIAFINRRDGAWEKPAPPSWTAEIVGVVLGLGVGAAVMWAHPWIAGVPLFY